MEMGLIKRHMKTAVIVWYFREKCNCSSTGSKTEQLSYILYVHLPVLIAQGVMNRFCKVWSVLHAMLHSTNNNVVIFPQLLIEIALVSQDTT